MTASPHWGICIPQVWFDDSPDPRWIRDFAERAENLGFGSLWTLDLKAKDFTVLDPIVVLSYLAAVTTRVQLGVSVLLPAFRRPDELAESWAALDRLSGGRSILGLGLGKRRAYLAHGLMPEQAVARFLESFAVIKALWREERVSYTGQHVRLEHFSLQTKPLQRPHPPIWFGGGHPHALRRAARLADGWTGAGAASTSEFLEQVRTIRQFLREEGRDPETFPVSKRVYIRVDLNERRAEQRIQTWLNRVHGGDIQAQQVAIYGPPDACARALRKLVAAKPDLLLLHPVDEPREQLERLALEVIPQVVKPR